VTCGSELDGNGTQERQQGTTRRAGVHVYTTACDASPWLREYASFHASQRCNASAATLVFHASTDKMRCTYLDDKFIVIWFALRVAAHTRRVLYIDWSPPCGVHPTYFEPTCILAAAHGGELGLRAHDGAQMERGAR
jgi:hypothetical protein